MIHGYKHKKKEGGVGGGEEEEKQEEKEEEEKLKTVCESVHKNQEKSNSIK